VTKRLSFAWEAVAAAVAPTPALHFVLPSVMERRRRPVGVENLQRCRQSLFDARRSASVAEGAAAAAVALWDQQAERTAAAVSLPLAPVVMREVATGGIETVVALGPFEDEPPWRRASAPPRRPPASAGKLCPHPHDHSCLDAV
jgi:hypothetical protein